MLENVKPGEKIRAQQYNELLAGIAGPAAASNEIPFTQTKNGIMFNGGCTSYQTKASAKFNSLLAISYSTGTIDEDFAGYDPNDPENLFDGIWYQNAYYSKLNQYFYHGQFFVQPIQILLIDPTTEDGDFKLVWLLKGAGLEPNGSTPLCKVDEQAALGVFQVSKCSSYYNPFLGATVAVVGNWKKLDDGISDGWNVYAAAAESSNMQKLVAQVKAKCPLLAELTELRFVAEYTMYDNYDELEEDTLDFPPVAYNVGQQHIESLPDAAQGHFELSAAELSSIEFTPSQNFGFNIGTPTWGYSLYNFGRYASDTLSTAYDPVVQRQVPEISAYDLLLRHKHEHSQAGSGNNNYLGRAEAVLEYISLSAMKDYLGNPDVDTQKTAGAQRSIDWHLSGDNKYLELYNFCSNGYDDALRVNLVYGQHRYATKDGSGEYPDPYVEFVVRDRSGNKMVKYDVLDIYAPPIYASDVTDLCTVISGIVEHECSCDLGPLSAALDALSAQLSNYWKVGGTYNDNCYGQSIGDDSGNPQIDLNNGQLLYSNELDPTVDWHNGYLSWNNAELRLDWSGCKAYDTAQEESIGWDSRQLKDAGGMPTVEWDSKVLNGDYGPAVDWQNHMLIPTGGSPTVEWADCILDDLNSTQSLDWNNRQLIGDWSCPYGDFSIGSGFVLKIGNTTLTEAQLQALLALINGVPQALQGI